MAENELEVRLNKKIAQLQSQISSTAVYAKRLHGLITHPSTLARVKTYVDKPIALLGDSVTALQNAFVAWVDYSDLSTIIGWSAFTTKSLEYKLVDDIIFVSVFIKGVSDSGVVSFTLSHAAKYTSNIKCLHCIDNGMMRAVNGMVSTTAASDIVTCTLDGDYTPWTDVNDKSIQGQFFYRVA